MRRTFLVLAAACAALVFAIPAADAGERKPVDPALDTVANVVGAGWTAGYFAINHWKWKWDAASAGISNAGAVVGTTMGCVAVSPMVATAVLRRPLSYREAHVLIGSCVIPIIGGWLVNEAYNNGWLWAPDEKPVHAARRKKSLSAASRAHKEAARKTSDKVAAAMPFDRMIAAH
jgi:hypothetical protein